MTNEPDSASTKHSRGPTPPIDNCARCRYPLTGLADDAPCPECGSSLRQAGPHVYRRANLHGAITCLAIGVLAMVLVATSRVVPILVAVPVLAIIAVMYCELDARDRRRAGLPRSNANLTVSLLGWCMFIPMPVLILLGLLIY